MNNMRQLVQSATQRLAPLHGEKHSNQIVVWLLEKLTGRTSGQLLASLDDAITEQQQIVFESWINKLVDESYPLQYILGTVQFGPLNLFIEPPVLIPRPETEEWVGNIIELLKPFQKQKLRILDMCTGSGCIGLWLAHEFANFQIDLVDNDHAALNLAAKNKAALKLSNAQIVNSDFFTNLTPASYNLIVSNPPYISQDAFEELSPTVKNWESRQALVASENGLNFYRLLAQEGSKFITKNPLLFEALPELIIEIGAGQKEAVLSLLTDNNWVCIRTQKDFRGKDRVLFARLKQNHQSK